MGEQPSRLGVCMTPQEANFCSSVVFGSCVRVLCASGAGQGDSWVLEQRASGNLVCSFTRAPRAHGDDGS